jgi:hypothetical protein
VGAAASARAGPAASATGRAYLRHRGTGSLGRRRCSKQGLDLEVAIVDDELEDLLNLGARCRRRQLDGPGEIGILRLELIQRRHAPQVSDDADRAQAAQLAYQQQRLVGIAEERLMWPEPQPPAGAGCRHRDRQGGSRRDRAGGRGQEGFGQVGLEAGRRTGAVTLRP